MGHRLELRGSGLCHKGGVLRVWLSWLALAEAAKTPASTPKILRWTAVVSLVARLRAVAIGLAILVAIAMVHGAGESLPPSAIAPTFALVLALALMVGPPVLLLRTSLTATSRTPAIAVLARLLLGLRTRPLTSAGQTDRFCRWSREILRLGLGLRGGGFRGARREIACIHIVFVLP